MPTYSVYFAPKHKKLCSFDFTIEADTPEMAQSKAVNLMIGCGENSLQFKPPKVRQLTADELETA